MAEELPVAAIVCIVLACWAVLILVIVGLCQFLKSRGVCKSRECAPCGKEGDPRCSECCISLSESCNCCKPSLDGCLNSVCGQRKCCMCQCGRDCSSACCDMKPNSNCCNTECQVFTCCCLEIRVKNPHLTSRNFNSSLASHSMILTDHSEANLSILTARSVKSASEIELSVRSTNSLLSSVHKPKTSSTVVKASSARLLPKPPQRTSKTERNVRSNATENTANKSVSKNGAQAKKVITEESNSQAVPVLKKLSANNFSDTSMHLNLSSGVTFKNELNTRRPQQASRPLPVPQLSTNCEEKSSFRKLPRLPD